MGRFAPGRSTHGSGAMVAIFSGSGAGFERGSGNVLGGMGLVGSGMLGRNGGQQLSVNAATGNLMIGRQDEFLVGRGPDVGISRTYNSLGNSSDENGDNWRQSTDRRISGLTGTANTAGSTVLRESGDGSIITYSWNAGAVAYVATDGAGAYDRLTYNSGTNVWTWTDGGSQATETYGVYGSYWRIATHGDTSGNSVSFSYSGATLYRATTADGSYTQYNWSGNNITQIVTGYTDLVTSTAKTLTRVRYGYDGYNRLTSVTVDESPTDNAVADGNTYVTGYTYHGTSKQVATITETDGTAMAITYDGSGRVATLVQTAASGVTRTTTLAYSAGYTTVTDPTGQVTRLDYDGSNRLTKITAPPAFTGAAAQIVQYAYNANGDMTSVTDAMSKVTTYTYDASGNVLTVTDPLGAVVTRTYNAHNQLLSETATGSNSGSASGQHTTRYIYDSADRLRWVISPQGRVTQFYYNSYGQLVNSYAYPSALYNTAPLAPTALISETDVVNWITATNDLASIQVTSRTYDARGNLTIEHDAGNYGDANGYTETRYVYDQAGQLLSRMLVGGATETFVYDGLGRITASTDVQGASTSFVFNDAASQTVVTLASGLVQTSTYNKAGELVSATDSGSYVTGGTTSYQYDANGRVRVATDANGYKSYFLYDKAGRKIADIDHYGWISEYRYDANSRVVATVRFSYALTAGQITTLGDPNSVVEMSAIRPAAYAADIWTWQVYDNAGRVIEAIGGDGSVAAYGYDASDRLVSTTTYVNKLAQATVNGFKTTAPATAVLPTAHANDSVARSFYDKDGRLIGQLDGEGYLSTVTYDGAGQKTAETRYANLTVAGNRATGTLDTLTSGLASAGDAVTRYAYDIQGQLIYAINALNQVTHYIYGTAALFDWNGNVRQSIQYAGAITPPSVWSVANIKAAVTAAGLNGAAANRTSWAVYDSAGRLSYAIDATGAVTGYRYDNMGNVTRMVRYAATRATASLPDKATMDSWDASNIGNAANRIARSYYNARGELRFTIDGEGYVTRNDYDAEGQLSASYRWDTAVAATDAWTIATVAGAVSGTWVSNSFTYDAHGRVAYAYNGEGQHRYYGYNANGTLAWDIRMLGTAAESRTAYVYDATGRVTGKYDAYGTTEQGLTQYGYDGRGNLTTIIDANNNVTTRTYDKLGRQLSETNALSGVTSWQYDSLDNVVKKTDVRNNSSYAYFDKLGRTVTVRDAEDYVTETVYSVFGEVTGVTRRANKATNTAAVGTLPVYTADPARDAVTTLEYDKLGRLTRTTDAMGAVTQLVLNSFGERATSTNALGGVTTSSYDRRGLLTQDSTAVSANYGAAGSAATNIVTAYQYDARGNRKQMVEASGATEARTTLYFYDKADRLIETRGMTVTVGLSPTNVTPSTFNIYDARGNLIETIDATGARILSWYDKRDREVARLVQNDATTGTYSTFAYDAAGNMTASRTYGTVVTLPAAGAAQPAAPAGEYRETVSTYDALHRRTTGSVAGQRIGSWNGSAYAITTGALTTTYQYDAAGNAILVTDPAGAATYNYFDKLGRKTAHVDPERYLTTWTLDAEGNVTSERRYASQSGTPVTSAPPSVGTTANDRVTNFTYDRNGRRLTQERTGVTAWAVNTSNGALTAASTSAFVTYTYNALGQVASKTEASGDATSYTYDNSGRLIMETRASFADYAGATVTPTVRYYYDRLGNLTSTVQGAAAPSASDHVTNNSYNYAQGGRLTSTTTAAGFAEQAVRSYLYDAAGRVVGEYYTRNAGSAGIKTEGVSYQYDKAGRLTRQGVNNIVSGVWTELTYTHSAYNAYGDLSQRGTNGVWAEQFSYDTAGRVIKANASDGLWREYIYDAAGRQTLEFRSTGTANVATIDVATMAASIGSTGATSIGGAITTITAYDKRGQATATIEPGRQLSTSVTQTITRTRGYNAFGEMASESDGRGNVTDYSYNSMGRLILKQAPLVSYTAENGALATARPTETYYYDLSGRLVGTRDANNNLNSRTLLAGSGYGGSAVMVLKEFHPDSGIAETRYDVFGDARMLIDELGRIETRSYDALGQLTVQAHVQRAAGSTGNPGAALQLIDYYAYDVLGQRVAHWNSQFGAGYQEKTEYDALGRVTKEIDYMGTATSYAYSWSAGATTSGLATYGGWVTATTNKAGRTQTETQDVFGRRIDLVDYGTHDYAYSFNHAGQLVAQTNNLGENIAYTYYNTGTLQQQVMNGITGNYAYDADGRRTAESWGTAQNAVAAYDQLGRMISWSDTGPNGTMPASTLTEYDLAGNVRRTKATHRPYGSSTDTLIDYWYRYDSMNRFVVAMGDLTYVVGSTVYTGDAARGYGTINRGLFGWDVTWNAASQRMTATRTLQVAIPNVIGSWGGPGGGGPIFGPPTIYNWDMRDYYTYTDDGYLAASYRITGNQSNSYAPATLPAGTPATETFIRDALGRVISSANGTVTTTYNMRSELLTQTVNNSYQQLTTTYDYNLETYAGSGVFTGAYQGGLLIHSRTTCQTWNSSGYGSWVAMQPSDTRNGYVWWQSAQLQVITYNPVPSATNTTTNYFDVSGRMTGASIVDSYPHSFTYVTDAQGRIMQRIDSGYSQETDYRFNGREMGYVSNQAVTTVPGNMSQTRYADFDQAYTPVASSSSDHNSTYTIQAGDNLRTIASSLWGDASLWYKLAEANGLNGDETLVAGRVLIVPQGVSAIHNNADTFQVYDPNRAGGDTFPGSYVEPVQPQPPAAKKKGGCGVFGQILIAAIGVAVSFLIPPIAPALGPILSGALTAAAVNVVTQGIAVATGLQDKFSWKGVALAAIGGGVGGALSSVGGKLGTFLKAETFVSNAVKGVLGSALTQGVAVATGLQKKFDWAGVAAAGISAGVVGEVGRALDFKSGLKGLHVENSAKGFVANAAGNIASAATLSLLNGSDFGDNLMASLPKLIGNTIGGLLVGVIQDQQMLSRMSKVEGSKGRTKAELWRASEVFEEVDGVVGQSGYAYGRATTESGYASKLWAVVGLDMRPASYSPAARDDAIAGLLSMAGFEIPRQGSILTDQVVSGANQDSGRAMGSLADVLAPETLLFLLVHSFTSREQAALTLGMVATRTTDIDGEWSAMLIQNKANAGDVRIMHLGTSSSGTAASIDPNLPAHFSANDWKVVGQWHYHPEQDRVAYGFSDTDYREAYRMQQDPQYGPTYRSFLTIRHFPNERSNRTYYLPDNLAPFESLTRSPIERQALNSVNSFESVFDPKRDLRPGSRLIAYELRNSDRSVVRGYRVPEPAKGAPGLPNVPGLPAQ
jgi:YD repeat-containing protein